MKILEVNKLYYPHIGGIESLVKQYSEGLSKIEGNDVRVLVCRDGKGKGYVETVEGVEVTRANSWGTYFSCPLSFDFFRKFRKMSRESDVVEIHTPFPLGDAALLLSGYKGKVVVAWHSDVVKQKKLLFFYKPFMNYLLKRADKIIVATKGHIDGSSYLPKYRDKCEIIPYGLDVEVYDSAPKTPVLTNKLNNKDNVKILFTGRLVYYKGVDILLKAFKDVKGAELFISGSGDLENKLKAYCADNGMEDRVHFMGFLSDEDLKSAFADCDMFVLPSVQKSEAFGIVQIEAMINGKPVINTNLPSGVPYVSLDKVTGFTVEPSDPEQLRDAIQKLTDDEALRASYGKAARERVLSEFNEKDIIVKLNCVLHRKRTTAREA